MSLCSYILFNCKILIRSKINYYIIKQILNFWCIKNKFIVPNNVTKFDKTQDRFFFFFFLGWNNQDIFSSSKVSLSSSLTLSLRSTLFLLSISFSKTIQTTHQHPTFQKKIIIMHHCRATQSHHPPSQHPIPIQTQNSTQKQRITHHHSLWFKSKTQPKIKVEQHPKLSEQNHPPPPRTKPQQTKLKQTPNNNHWNLKKPTQQPPKLKAGGRFKPITTDSNPPSNHKQNPANPLSSLTRHHHCLLPTTAKQPQTQQNRAREDRLHWIFCRDRTRPNIYIYIYFFFIDKTDWVEN